MTKQEFQDLIDQKIYENDKGEVTATVVNDVLSNIVDNLFTRITPDELPDTLMNKVTEANTFLTGKLGRIQTSGQTAAFTSSGRYIYNSTAVTANPGFATKISITISVAGDKYFSIGTPNGANGFTPRKRLGPYAMNVGINEIVINETFNIGETIAINGGTAEVRYNTVGGDATGRWIEATTSAIVGQSSLSSFVCLLIDYRYTLNGLLRKIAVDANLPDKLADLAVAGAIRDPLTLGFSTVRDTFLSFPATGYVGNNTPFPADGKLISININLALAGNLKLSIGSLDQSNFFLKEIDIIKSIASTGEVTVALNIDVKKGQILLIDKASTARVGTATVAGNTYLNVNNYDDALTTVPAKNLSYNLIYTEIVPVPFATPKQIAELQSRCDSLDLLIDALRPKQTFQELVVLGNSLAEHVIETVNIGWWGLYGMAASKRENDFAHVLQSKMLENSPGIVMRVRRTNDWEGTVSNNTAFTYSSLNTALGDATKSKAVVVRLLDNVKNNLDQLPAKCIELLTYIKTYCTHPDTTIIATGSWYASAEKDLAMKNACASLGLLYIPISQLATTENKSAVGNLVMGDDGLQHAIFNSGVATHPSDSGHLAIATNLYSQLKYKKV